MRERLGATFDRRRFFFRNLESAPALTSRGGGAAASQPALVFPLKLCCLERILSLSLSLSLTQPEQNLTLGFGLSPCNYTTWLVVWDTVKSLPALNLEITCGVRDIMLKTQNLPRGDDKKKNKREKR